LGCAILYVNTGTTSLDGIYIITTITDIASNIELLYGGIGQGNILNTISPVNMADTYYINISLIILSVGFLFKVSAAPFHF
jgi:NADH-ubiquinone oxidoreductase chain 2